MSSLCNTKAHLSVPGAITLNHSGGAANSDWSQPHSIVTHVLSCSEARKENNIPFLAATPYLRNPLAWGTASSLDLPTIPLFHAFATQDLHPKPEKKSTVPLPWSLSALFIWTPSPPNFMYSYLGSPKQLEFVRFIFILGFQAWIFLQVMTLRTNIFVVQDKVSAILAKKSYI